MGVGVGLLRNQQPPINTTYERITLPRIELASIGGHLHHADCFVGYFRSRWVAWTDVHVDGGRLQSFSHQSVSSSSLSSSSSPPSSP